MKAKKSDYMMKNTQNILMPSSIASIMNRSKCLLVLTQCLLILTLFQFLGSFIDVFLEVMMILTLSHFENQLHPSRHTNASSHAVDPFFCSVRGSFGKKMKTQYQCQGSFSVKRRLTGTLRLSNKTLVYDSPLLHSNVQPLTHIKEKQT